MEPAYSGMPAANRTYEIGKWGNIRLGGACKDDYARIIVYEQDGQHYLKLQRAAIESIKAVEVILADKGFKQHPFVYVTGHGWRACSDQAALYATSHTRYAPPSSSIHCRGLAIDVDMNQDAKKRKVIRNELLARHWFQSRPSDEPWHYSFGGLG